MKKETINELFERLHGDFDIENANEGHQKRFLDKLNGVQTIPVSKNNKGFQFWKPLLALAASLVIGFAIFTAIPQPQKVQDLASVSPELSKTQDFFNAAIAQELTHLKTKRSPATNILIDDALEQLKLLEKNYKQLKLDLMESGNDKRVIYAMIANFQNRIELLQNVMIHIEEVEDMNTTPNIL